MLLTIQSYGQQPLIYSQYFLNPFLFNPSYVAPNGYSELYLNYRKQWSGIEGAPETATLNFHLPVSTRTGLGFTAYQDKAGVLETTTGLVTFAYQIYLGKRMTDVHKIGFGLSVGLTNSRVNMDEVDDPNDPSLSNSTSSMDGQAGINYQYNNLKISFAIPRLFESHVVSEEGFNQPGIEQVNNTVSSISYLFKVGAKVSIEPYVLYRTSENQPDQFEVLGVARFGNVGWAGGAYRQDYGATAFLGANIKDRLKLGYAYEFATDQVDAFGDGTHEVQLVVRLGKKKFERVAKEEPVKEQTEAVAEEKEQPLAKEPPKEDVAQESHVAPVVVPTNNNQQAQTTDTKALEPIKEVETPTEKPKTLSGEGLDIGHYVVVGAFRSVQNAKNYAQTLKRAGYPSDVAFYPDRGYYIVHMGNVSTIDEARELRDRYRQMSRYSFRDTWILNVE
jgi:type IX secretion system PorP/SprF family membrane protein